LLALLLALKSVVDEANLSGGAVDMPMNRARAAALRSASFIIASWIGYRCIECERDICVRPSEYASVLCQTRRKDYEGGGPYAFDADFVVFR